MTAIQKRVILFMVLTIGVLAGLNYYIRFLLDRCQVGSIAKVNAVMAHELEADVTVWGSSTAIVHFNPAIMEQHLKISCFNLGMDGVPFQQYGGLLAEYIEYSKTARVLVISVDVTGFKRRPSLYQGYNWLHHIGNDHIYESIQSIDPELAFKSRFVPLYYITTYDRRFLFRCLSWVYSPPPYMKRELDSKGFRPENIAWEEHGENFQRESDAEFQLEVDSTIVSHFKTIVQSAKAKGINVAIVIPPCYIEFQNRIPNKEEFESAIASFTSDEVKIFDFLNSQICSNRNYFYNNLHMNSQGADVFSNQFGVELKEWLELRK